KHARVWGTGAIERLNAVRGAHCERFRYHANPAGLYSKPLSPTGTTWHCEMNRRVRHGIWVMASLLMLATAAAHDETVDPVREAEEALLAAATAGKQSGDPAVQAATLRNLAVFYRTQGRIEEAANLHESALRLRQRNLGRYHPDVVQSLIDVGQLHLEAGELRKTAQFFRRALRAEQKLRGPDHIATAIHLNSLARVEAMR